MGWDRTGLGGIGLGAVPWDGMGLDTEHHNLVLKSAILVFSTKNSVQFCAHSQVVVEEASVAQTRIA